MSKFEMCATHRKLGSGAVMIFGVNCNNDHASCGACDWVFYYSSPFATVLKFKFKEFFLKKFTVFYILNLTKVIPHSQGPYYGV